MYSGHGRLCVYVCLSVPCRIPALLHRPGCKLHGGMVEVRPSCALLGGFPIGAWISLLWQHSTNAKCQRVLVLAVCLACFCIYALLVCNNLWVQTLDYWHKGSNGPSIRSLVRMKKGWCRWVIFPGWVQSFELDAIAVSFFYCFDTVVWLIGSTFGLQNRVPRHPCQKVLCQTNGGWKRRK